MTKKFQIPREGKKFLGVAAAIAKYTDIDVTVIRIIWVLLLLPGGLPGIVPYLLIWLLSPEEKR